MLQGGVPPSLRESCLSRAGVFQKERHAAERALRKVGARSVHSGFFEPPVDDRIQPSVERLDAGDRRVAELQGRRLAAFDESGLGGRVKIREHVHVRLFLALVAHASAVRI